MKKIIVHGAGLVGRIIAFDLYQQYQVTVVDNDAKRLASLEELVPEVSTLNADLTSEAAINYSIADADLVIGALPPSIGFQVLRQVIDAGKNTVQVSTLLEDASELDVLAEQRGITAVMDAGVVPGLPNLILGYHQQQADVEEYECLFGSLPTTVKPPLYHQDYYPVREVLGEYLHPVTTIEQGATTIHAPLVDAEQIEFPELGTLEAVYFNGLGSLQHTMRSKVRKMSHKMLRFPQHLDYIRSLNASGFLSDKLLHLDDKTSLHPIDITAQLLTPFMRFEKNESDWIAMRITIRTSQECYVYHLLDCYDDATQFSAMSRTTGYTCTSIARQMLVGELYLKKGVIFPEVVGMQPDCYWRIMSDLKTRGLEFDVRINGSAS